MMKHMVKAGESTGNVDGMMTKIADFYDTECEATVAALTSLIEPLLIVFLGVVVGGIVMAMFLPIFQLGAWPAACNNPGRDASPFDLPSGQLRKVHSFHAFRSHRRRPPLHPRDAGGGDSAHRISAPPLPPTEKRRSPGIRPRSSMWCWPTST
jgi:hypothetical protein